MTLKTIIFDLDDTLLWDKQSIQSAFDETCKLASEDLGIDAKQLEEAVRSEARALYESYDIYPYTVKIGINPFEGLWGTFDDPTPEFQRMKEIIPTYQHDAWDYGLQKLGINNSDYAAKLAKTFIEERIKHPYLYEDSLSVLEQLKENYQLILLTNGAPSLQNLKLKLTPELVPFFDYIFISGDFGVGKPDASLFEHVVKTANLNVGEAIMVGDNQKTDILGSNRINMRNVWINRDNIKPNEDIPFTYEVSSLIQLAQLVKTL